MRLTGQGNGYFADVTRRSTNFTTCDRNTIIGNRNTIIGKSQLEATLFGLGNLTLCLADDGQVGVVNNLDHVSVVSIPIATITAGFVLIGFGVPGHSLAVVELHGAVLNVKSVLVNNVHTGHGDDNGYTIRGIGILTVSEGLLSGNGQSHGENHGQSKCKCNNFFHLFILLNEIEFKNVMGD